LSTIHQVGPSLLYSVVDRPHWMAYCRRRQLCWDPFLPQLYVPLHLSVGYLDWGLATTTFLSAGPWALHASHLQVPPEVGTGAVADDGCRPADGEPTLVHIHHGLDHRLAGGFVVISRDAHASSRTPEGYECRTLRPGPCAAL